MKIMWLSTLYLSGCISSRVFFRVRSRDSGVRIAKRAGALVGIGTTCVYFSHGSTKIYFVVVQHNKSQNTDNGYKWVVTIFETLKVNFKESEKRFLDIYIIFFFLGI